MADTLTFKSQKGSIDLKPQDTTLQSGGSINFHYQNSTSTTATITEAKSGYLSVNNHPDEDSDDMTIPTTHWVRLHGGGGGKQVIFAASGTTSADTNKLNIGMQLIEVSQVLYVNLDMGIVLPSEYTLSVDGKALEFTNTITAGTNYSILYTAARADIEAGLLPQVYSISSTTTTSTSTLSVGVELTKDRILALNIGNTLLLPETYEVSGTDILLNEPIEAGIHWNVRYITQVASEVIPMKVVTSKPTTTDPHTLYFIVAE